MKNSLEGINYVIQWQCQMAANSNASLIKRGFRVISFNDDDFRSMNMKDDRHDLRVLLDERVLHENGSKF